VNARIEPATEQHLWLFGLELTAADDAAVAEYGWTSAFETYSTLLEQSIEAHAGCFDGRVGCLLGVRHHPDGGGAMWFHSAPLFVEQGRRMLRPARELFAGLLLRWSPLRIHVPPENAALVRLAQWVGFELAPPVPTGHLARPFHHAVLRRH
jgi:hypothetical protein